MRCNTGLSVVKTPYAFAGVAGTTTVGGGAVRIWNVPVDREPCKVSLRRSVTGQSEGQGTHIEDRWSPQLLR